MFVASSSRSSLVRRITAQALASSSASSSTPGPSSSAPSPRLSQAGSSRWSSSTSESKDEEATSTASSTAGPSSATAGQEARSSASGLSGRGSGDKSLNRKQRFAHKIPQPYHEALLQKPLSSSSSPPTQRSDEAELPPFTLNDFASMSSLLYNSDPILDSGRTIRNAPTPSNPFPSSVTMHNEDPETGGPIFPPTPPSASSLVLSASSGGSQEVDSAAYLASVTPLSPAEINALHRHTLVIKRVVRMTTKGKVASMYALVVAGNGKGMVGYGEGKDQNAGKAAKKAFHEAVKKMDYVKRFEGRTIFSEYTSKWGASKITLRPRPAGFGLRVPPVIHSLARAAGIADLSASIRGSANPLNVVKAACQTLWSGALPNGLGDGIGGTGRRNDKGRGMLDVREIELARGRKLREIRLRM